MVYRALYLLVMLLTLAACETADNPAGSSSKVTTAYSETVMPVISTAPEMNHEGSQGQPEWRVTPALQPTSEYSTTPAAATTPMSQQGEGMIITPTLKILCPAHPEVLVSELNIPSYYGLALKASTSFADTSLYPLYRIFPGDSGSAPEIMIQNGYHYRSSSDQRWISFEQPGDHEEQKVLWMSSSDGELQWPVIPMQIDWYAPWATSNQIVLVGLPYDDPPYDFRKDYYKVRPLSIVNPFTQEQQPLAIVNSDYWFYGDLPVINERLYAIYNQAPGPERFIVHLYDYGQNIQLPAFQWLREDWLLEATQLLWQDRPLIALRPGGFLVAVYLRDGIDLAIDLDLDEALSNKAYHEMMTHVVIPEHLRAFDLRGVSQARNRFAFTQYNLEDPGASANWLFILDYEYQEIREYCYSETRPLLRFSPDGRFAAFTISGVERPENRRRDTVIVMDLDTGEYARIADFSVLGWLIRE